MCLWVMVLGLSACVSVLFVTVLPATYLVCKSKVRHHRVFLYTFNELYCVDFGKMFCLGGMPAIMIGSLAL